MRLHQINLLRPFLTVALVATLLGAIASYYLLDRFFERTLVELNQSSNIVVAGLIQNNVLHELGNDAGQTRTTSDLMGFIATTGKGLIEEQIRGTNILKVKVYSADGYVIYSTSATDIGQSKKDSEELQRTLRGEVQSRYSYRDKVYAQQETIHSVNVVSTYIPLRSKQDNEPVGVFELYADVSADARKAHQLLLQLVSGIITIMVVISAVLVLIVRRSQSRVRRQQRAVHQRAVHDPLTGLPNRLWFNEMLKQELSRAERQGRSVALLYIDLNKFKYVNDTLGHHAGDALLKIFAQRLKSVVREYDHIARIGGDEFSVIAGAIEEHAEIEKLAQRIIDVTSTKVSIEGHDLDVSISLGIATYPNDAANNEDLLRAADTAMFHAKSAGRNLIRYFTAEMDMQSRNQSTLNLEVTRALRDREFSLFYQAKVDSGSGNVVGAEALIRWKHPARGMVSPLDFIPQLEESGKIVEVGEWVIRETCMAIQQWKQQGLIPVPVSVNVSPMQFHSGDLAGTIEQLIAEFEIEPALLEIEITENCLMSDVDANMALLERIKQLGVGIAVDDFGSGYSSLSYLKRFPIDTLKIDRSFITDINQRSDNDNAAIVTAIMALSHSLRLKVVAEGVETAQELAYLNALGCRTIQGFLFSRPVEEAEFRNILRDSMLMKQTFEEIRKELELKQA